MEGRGREISRNGGEMNYAGKKRESIKKWRRNEKIWKEKMQK